MLALAAGSSALTMWAQSLVAAFKPLDLQYRVGNALVSYAAYIGQMFYPAGMVVQYVHPGPSLRLQDTLLPAGGPRRDHAGRRLAGLAAALPGGRLVLVSGHARAGDRIGAGGRPGPRRPLHLPDADRPVHHDRLGPERPGPELAQAGRFSTPPWPRRSSACWLPSPGCRLPIGRTASPCGSTASPAKRKRTISPRTSTRSPWPTPATKTRPWNTTSSQPRSIPSTSRRGSTRDQPGETGTSRPKPCESARTPCRLIPTTFSPTSSRP